MIHKTTLYEAMFEAIRLAAVRMPGDVEAALQRAFAEEREPLAREHLAASLENARSAAAGEGLVCGDTGFPLFYVRLGRDADIEGGIPSLWEAARDATARATAERYLRPTMVDPLTRGNPGANCGPGMPKVDLRCGPGNGLDLIAAPKGGGSEIFGTFYRMMFPADGIDGIKTFVIDCIRDACYAGKVCPPALVGVGIGGTSDLCMKMAKEAAVLRPLGSANPRADLAALENELLAASRRLGIGPMGSRGINAALAVHVSAALTHTAALPVAVNAQCLIGRRWRATVSAAGDVAYSDDVMSWWCEEAR